MNIEELRESLKDEETREQFVSLIKEIGFKSSEEVEGLVSNRDKLKLEKMQEKEKRIELQKKLDNIDLDGYSKYIDNLDKDDKSSNDFKKLQKQYDDVNDKLQKINKEFDVELKGSRINAALSKANIDPLRTNMLTSALKGRATVEIDDGKRQVLIENNGGLRLPVEEFIKEWVDTEEGQSFLAKPNNKGAGSSPFSGSSAASIKRSDFDTWSPDKQREAVKQVNEGTAKFVE